MDAMLPDDNEVDLINRARTDPEAFGQLYERYVERIYNYIYFRVGNVEDAEDLTAKVFMKALNAIGGYRHMGLPFSAWLYRIAHNQVANFHRDHSRITEIPIDQLELPALSQKMTMPEINALHDQEAACLLRLVQDLPDDKRELVLLKVVHDLSNQEIGAILNRSESAIKSLYHRTLLELRESMRLQGLDRNE
jgi:RNA polymerase sigma-70 factor (ECF subfamily)